jgi:sulfur-oxidizing protein SoxY
MPTKARILGASGAAALAVFVLATGAATVRADMWDSQRKEAVDQFQGTTSAWDNIKHSLFADKEIADGAGVVKLEAPPRVTDAAFIPVTISSEKTQTAQSYVKNIYLVIDENPSPVAAVFHMTPDSGVANISTRVRIDKYTHVRAIAETNDGKLYMAAAFLKAAGGCSAPGLEDNAEARATLGKMKMNFIKAAADGQPGEAQIMVKHPNFTGFQFDQVARHEIPAEFVNSVEVTYGGTKVLSIEPGISISENPSFFFYYKDRGPGEMKAVIKDSEGRVFEKSWPVGASDANG